MIFLARNLDYVKRILFVDDSAIVRATLRRIFEQGGWTCSEAANGREGLATAREFKPDVIVLDLSMPVMNGLTAGPLLKEILPEIPLILFTSFEALLTSEQIRNAGFSAFVGKSDAGELMTTAQNLLSFDSVND